MMRSNNRSGELGVLSIEQRSCEISYEALRRIIRADDVYSRALLREHNLTQPQLRILKELARVGTAPIGTLAKATLMGAPTATGIVDRLERHELVIRLPSKLDRRQVLIGITAAGKQLLEQNPSLTNDSFRDQFRRMSDPQQRQMCNVLQRVAKMMEIAASAAE